MTDDIHAWKSHGQGHLPPGKQMAVRGERTSLAHAKQSDTRHVAGHQTVIDDYTGMIVLEL